MPGGAMPWGHASAAWRSYAVGSCERLQPLDDPVHRRRRFADLLRDVALLDALLVKNPHAAIEHVFDAARVPARFTQRRLEGLGVGAGKASRLFKVDLEARAFRCFV